MDHPAARPVPARTCAWCGQALGRLRAMRRDVCERPSCMAQDAERTLRMAQAQAAQQLRARAAKALGPARTAAAQVVWIRPHDTTLAPLPDTLREEHVRHLRSIAGLDEPLAAPLEAADPASEAAAPDWMEARLCAWCGGRCCRFGGQNHAYIEGSHLQRWADSHAAATLADAVQAYVDRLPAWHVQGSCAYHGERGCTLDRDMRSEICNRFVCDGLRDVQRRTGRDAVSDGLFVMAQGAQVERAVLADPAGLGALPDLETP